MCVTGKLGLAPVEAGSRSTAVQSMPGTSADLHTGAELETLHASLRGITNGTAAEGRFTHLARLFPPNIEDPHLHGHTKRPLLRPGTVHGVKAQIP